MHCLICSKDRPHQTFESLEDNNIFVVKVPLNCTDWLQPLEFAVNKPLKDQIKTQFYQWYSKEIEKRVKNAKTEDSKVSDLKLCNLKPLGFKWLKEACAYVKKNNFIKNGFIEARITEALSSCVPAV